MWTDKNTDTTVSIFLATYLGGNTFVLTWYAWPPYWKGNGSYNKIQIYANVYVMKMKISGVKDSSPFDRLSLNMFLKDIVIKWRVLKGTKRS